MKPSTARYDVKADKREFASLVAAYATVFISALALTFLTFRVAHLLGRYRTGVDPLSYVEMHVYIVLIEVVLWLVMARAAIRFKAYAWRIRHSQDGSALNLIATAILLSFIYAILFDAAATFKPLFLGSAYLPAVITTTNLLPLAMFLLLSALLFVGSRRLSRLVPSDTIFGRRHQRATILSLALFALLVIPYGEYFYQAAPMLTDDDGLNHFILPPAVLIAVYLAPFIAIWLLGLLSCLNLAKYAHQVAGKIYKPTFRNLYAGILISYISTYLIQLFYLSNAPSSRFGFGLLLAAGLLVMLIIGYSLIYRGANQLYMLERGPSR